MPLVEANAGMGTEDFCSHDLELRQNISDNRPRILVVARMRVNDGEKSQEGTESNTNRRHDIRIRMRGAALVMAAAGAVLYSVWPRRPEFRVEEMSLKGFHLRFNSTGGKALGIPVPTAVIDVDIRISISVCNPNIAPVDYKASLLRIFYHGSLLGEATVCAGSQGAHSSELVDLVAKMDGMVVRNHVKELAEDVIKREMQRMALVTMDCSAWLWKWGRKFQVDVESHIVVDPLFLDVIHQDNIVHLQF